MSPLGTINSITAQTMPRMPEIYHRQMTGTPVALGPSFTDHLRRIAAAPAEPPTQPEAPSPQQPTIAPPETPVTPPSPQQEPTVSPHEPELISPEMPLDESSLPEGEIGSPLPEEPLSEPTAVPPEDQSPPVVEPEETAPAAPKQPVSLLDRYEVREGDTLSEIAYDLRKTIGSKVPLWTIIQQIANDNHITNPDLIYPGTVLDVHGAIEAAGGKAVPQTSEPQPNQEQESPISQPQTPKPEIQYAAYRRSGPRPLRTVEMPAPSVQVVRDSQQTEHAARSEQVAPLDPASFKPLPLYLNTPAQTANANHAKVIAQDEPEMTPEMQEFERKLLESHLRYKQQRENAGQAMLELPSQVLSAPSDRSQVAPPPSAMPNANAAASSAPVGEAESQPEEPLSLRGPAAWGPPTDAQRMQNATPSSGLMNGTAPMEPARPPAASTTTATGSDLFETTAPPLETQVPPEVLQSMQKRGAVSLYAHEQLLDNPGGDAYARANGVTSFQPGNDENSFSARVGKDLSDAGENLKRLVGDMTMGSTSAYQTDDNRSVELQRRGLLGSMVDFAKDFATGITFGAFNPNNEPLPQGMNRVGYGLKKMLLDGVAGDLLGGVPSSAVHAVEDLTLAALNTGETVPDATFGNISSGKKATSHLFDGTQVLVNGLMDVMPSGDAWARVYAAGREGQVDFPIYSNLTSPESGSTDPRYIGVTNTGFRKGVETVGALGAAVLPAVSLAPAAAGAVSGAAAIGSDASARRELGSLRTHQVPPIYTTQQSLTQPR